MSAPTFSYPDQLVVAVAAEVAADASPRYDDALVAAITAEVTAALLAEGSPSTQADEQSSRRLTAIDRDLRTKLLVACNAALKRSLEKAGAKIISKSRVAAAAPIRERIKNVEAWRVPSVVGPLALQAALGLSGADVLDTEYADLKRQWHDWVATAQDAALRVAAQLARVPLATAYARTSQQFAADRDDGWDQLQGALGDRADELLNRADEDQPLNGDTLVPPQTVRAAIAVAGGFLSTAKVRGVKRAINNSQSSNPNDPLMGIGTGDTIGDMLVDLGAQRQGYQWLHGMADRPLEGHLALDGTEFNNWDDDALRNSDDFPSNDYFYSGDHAGCFVGSTEVSGPAPVSTFSRYYEGPLVEIVTRGGKQLSVTPNHPILTDQGWIAAGLLEVGSHLVCGSGVEWMAPSIPDDQQRPARIDDVVNAFPMNRSVSTKPVVVAAEDFHGDGRYSEVGIIRADRLLAHEVNIEISEPTPQFNFGWAIGQAARLFTSGVGNLPFEFEFASPRSAPASSGTGRPPFRSAALQVDLSRRSRTATLDSRIEQTSFDDVSVYAVALCQSILRLAGQISLDDVSVIRVVELYQGHVYNLGTRVGWYLADGIIAHNCSCDVIVMWQPVPEREVGIGAEEEGASGGASDEDSMAAAGLTAAFNPDQPRDPDGKFASTGGSDSAESRATRVDNMPGSVDPKDPNSKLPFNTRLGRCYELSAQYQLNNPGSTLVHGTIQGAGQSPLDHAWVETKDGRVFEPATGHQMSITEFHDSFHPNAEVAYSGSQASHEMLDTGHYGPWAAEAQSGGPTGNYEQDAARVLAIQNEYLAAGRDTQSVYDRIDGKENKYSDEREQLHQQIIDQFTKGDGIESDRRLLVMAGLPGAGKTTFLTSEEGQATVGVDLSKYVSVNADDVKAELFARGAVPDYPGLTANEATSLVHEESSYVAKQVLATAIANGQNVAYDVTLSRASQLTEALQLAQQTGNTYQTTAVLVDTPVEKSIDRAISRYENGGRFVPTDYINSLRTETGDSKPVIAFNEIKSSVDKWATVNNHGAAPVITVGSNSPGILVPS